jgi:methyl-accepting chemotaxis protein
MRVGRRIATVVGATIFCLAVVLAIALAALRSLHGEVTYVTADLVPKIEKVSDWKMSLMRSSRLAADALDLNDPHQLEDALAALKEERAIREKIIDWLKEHVKRELGKKTLADLQEARTHYSESEMRFAALAAKGDKPAAGKLLLEETRPRQLDYLKGIDAFLQVERNLIVAQGQASAATYESTMLLLLSLSGIALLLAGLGIAFLARSITRQLGGEPDYAARVVREIATGNLAVEIDTRRDDTASLIMGMKEMRDSLLRIVEQVRESSDSIATGSGQIASGNQDLSERTEQQASALQQTAASMEQLTATVKQSADNAKQANQVAASASEAAARGGDAVNQVVAVMEAITASSRKIADITNVIDGIAFQTNILALNAAVEAARAGDQGRGFAVVAGEVRSLAHRSAQAAREIKGMINESAKKVSDGSELVINAGESMKDIVSQVNRVTDLIAEITSAALEQSEGIGQVNEAVTQMDQSTQQNAALVEQSAAAAISLKEQADRLIAAVSVFRLQSRPARPAVKRAPGAPAVAASLSAPAATPRSPERAAAKAKATATTGTAKAAGDNWEEF